MTGIKCPYGKYEKRRVQLKIYGDIAWVNLENYSLEPDQWQHLCLSVSSKSKQVQIVMNGLILQNETMDGVIHEEITNDKMWIGGMAPLVDFPWKEERRMEGAITEVNIWNETLGAKHLISITSNHMVVSNAPQPSALYLWQTLKVQSNTSCIEYIKLERNDELFNENPQKNVLIQYLADINTSNYLCHAFF